MRNAVPYRRSNIRSFRSTLVAATRGRPYAEYSDPMKKHPIHVNWTDRLLAVYLVVTGGMLCLPTLTAQTNHPPVVTLVTPTNGATFTAPAEIQLVANAQDEAGFLTIRTVEFFAGTTRLGTTTNIPTSNPLGPFAMTWKGVPPGQYVLFARARDELGSAGISAPVNVSVWPSNAAVVRIEATENLATELPEWWPDFNAAVFTVSRKRPDGEPLTTGPLSVFFTVSGTASNGVDYARVFHHDFDAVHFAEGASDASILITPLDDALREGTETVTLTLQPSPPSVAPNWYVIGSPSNAVAYILDDETPPPVVTIEATDPIATEGPIAMSALDTALFSVHRTGELGHPLDLGYRVSGTASNGVDYAPLSGRVVLPAGSNRTHIAVIPMDDLLVEATETVRLELLPPPPGTPLSLFALGTPHSSTACLQDNDPVLTNLVQGVLRKELYLDVPGIFVTNLTQHPKFPDHPDQTEFVPAFEIPMDMQLDLNNYGARLSGFLIPPETGLYTFYLSSDDQGALFLSLDEYPAHKSLIAVEPGWSGPRTWIGPASGRTNTENISVPIELRAGRLYYVEALMKEGGGGDHLGVAWQKPGDPVPANGDPPIGAEYLAVPATWHSSNLAPSVTLLTPTNGALFPTGANILLGATASDPDGNLGIVEFFANSNRLGSAVGPFGSPHGEWTLIWSNVPPGAHVLTARATDSAGLVTASLPVTITVGDAPPPVRELHVVGVHEAATVSVVVDRPGKAVTLFLSAYNPVTWQVSVMAGSQIEKVILGGYHAQTAVGLPPETLVIPAFYEGGGSGYLWIGYQIDAAQFQRTVPKLHQFTGLEIASFQGQCGNPYPAYLINGVMNDARLRSDYPQPMQPSEWPVNPTFQLSFFSGSGAENGNVFHRTYTLAGPPGGSTLLPGMRVVADAGRRFYYAASSSQGPLKVDSHTGAATQMQLGANVPELSWPMCMAFDSQRARVLLASLGGEGFLYAYAPQQSQWSLVASMDNRDVDSLVYHPSEDRLYAFDVYRGDYNRPTIFRYNAAGTYQSEIQLPFLPYDIGVAGYQSELVSVGDYLVLLIAPEPNFPPADQAEDARMYLIDPRSGESWLTYRQAGSGPVVPPVITTQPVSRTRYVGQSVAFSVIADDPLLTYQWQFKGTAIAGATDPSFVIPVVDSGDAGSYAVVVGNSAGSVTSDVATLTVNSIPTTFPPSVSFACNCRSSTGYESSNYELPMPDDLASELHVIGVYEGLAHVNGTVTVRVNTTNKPVVLALSAYLPVIWSIVTVPGAQVQAVFVSGYGDNAQMVIGLSPSVPVHRVSFGAYGYGWEPHHNQGGGNYGIMIQGVRQITGLVESSFQGCYAGVSFDIPHLTDDNRPPQIIRQPMSLSIAEGQTAVFSIEATGSPAVHYQWRWFNQYLPGATNATLVLSNVQQSQAGQYLVEVRNVANTVTSQPATLTVLPAHTGPGSLDLTFHARPGLDGWRYGLDCIVPQPDGKLLIGGYFTNYGEVPRNGLARLNHDGSLDTSFAPRLNTPLEFPAGIGAITLQPDRKILIGGWFTSVNDVPCTNFARLHPDGRLDESFAGHVEYGTVQAITLQPDNRILIGGSFWSINGVEQHYLARLHPDGRLDSSFVPASLSIGDDWYITALGLQSDGSVIVAGHIFDIPWEDYLGVVRLHPDGSLDTEFRNHVKAEYAVFHLFVLPDDKILVDSGVMAYGAHCGGPSRLNADGTLDTGFQPLADLDWRWAMAVAPDGKVLVGGFDHLIQLNVDGSLNSRFQTSISGGADNRVLHVAVQPDGQVLIEGDFTHVNGEPVHGFTRLNGDLHLPTPFVFRDITADGTIRLVASPANQVSVYAVEDQPPTGWPVTNVSHSGLFDSRTGKVKFGPFFDHEPRALTYRVLPPTDVTGVFPFLGTASADGVNSPIGGGQQMVLVSWHPAEMRQTRPADWRLSIEEVTAYASAWRRGLSWQAPPNPIRMDYVTRAAALWRQGECYKVDPSVTVPPLWWVSCEPVIAKDAAGASSQTHIEREVVPVFVPGEGISVNINVRPPSRTMAYAVEEHLPVGWQIEAVSHQGEADVALGIVRWGPFFDATPRQLSYRLTSSLDAAGMIEFGGRGSFDGISADITGGSRSKETCRLTAAPNTTSGSMRLSLSGRNGARYRIEASGDLEHWELVGQASCVQGQLLIEDSAASQHRWRFYRAVAE